MSDDFSFNTQIARKGTSMPNTKAATKRTPAKKKRTPAPRVTREVNVVVTMKGTGCRGQQTTLKLSREGSKVTAIHYADYEEQSFKFNLDDMKKAIELLSEEVVIPA